MYLFQDMKNAAKGINFNSAKEARDWYRDQAMKITNVDRTKVMYTADPFKIFQTIATDKKRQNTELNGAEFVTAANIGKMYMYFYDAKHKDTLPFFDMFPLIFPIEFYHDGFLGINLHYLPPLARAMLMDALWTTANNQKYNSTTILQINYRILKQSALKFAGYQECVKRYLYSHVKSAFHYVNPSDWDKALLLPMQHWHINPNRKYSQKASPP